MTKDRATGTPEGNHVTWMQVIYPRPGVHIEEVSQPVTPPHPARRFARCADCRRRVMLPRWVDGELVAGDIGDEWWCMDCTGESERERIEFADDYRVKSP